MNAELIRQMLTPEAFAATAPFVALCVGILLMLLVEILPGTSSLRPLVFLGSLAAAFGFAWTQARGGESRVFADTYVANSITGWWSILFVAATLVAWLFGRRYYKEEAAFEGEHDVLLLASAAGMVLMAGSRDLLVFFVGLELLSVPLYTLSGFRRSRRESVESALKYFVLGAFAAAIFLFGSALVYAGTGTLTLSKMGAAALLQPITIAGAVLVAASLFFKISVFPFHLWVPDVYQGAPSPVTTFMATGTKAAAFAFLLPMSLLLPKDATTVLAIVAVATMAIGNLGALVQTDLKRLLAYSGIAHAGTMLLAIAAQVSGGASASDATRAIVYYMAAYVFTAGGAFGLVTAMEGRTGRPVTIDSLKGLAQRSPLWAATFALFALSLGGIPATGGFLGKYLVFSTAVDADMIGWAIAGILMSVVALGYYLRLIVAMYMQESTSAETNLESRPWANAMAVACAAGVVVLGVLPNLLLDRLG